VLWMRRYLQEAPWARLQACGRDPKPHSSHSLRAGGAVFQSSAGFGREVIAVHGRWSSDSLDLYLKLQQHSLRASAIGRAGVTEEMVKLRGREGIRCRD